MPRKSQGARLYERSNGIFSIRDGARFITTGTRDRRRAEGALARYIAERNRPARPSTPDQVTVADVLEIYGRERAQHVKDPARIGYAIAALLPILGDLLVGSITGAICRRYGEARGKAPGTVRKELGTLSAAINYCHSEGYLTTAPRVRLPEKPPSRDRWLTRDEAARLLRAAYRNPKARHLARFILVAIYSGTRSQAILSLRFMPHTGGGWVDTEAGMMYRRGVGQAKTKKRQPPIPIPRSLLAHLRRWQRKGSRHVVEIDGQRVAEVKHSWATALKEAGIEHATRYDLRHTAITWAMQSGCDRWAAAGFFGVTMDVLEGTSGHHHPDYLRSVVEAMDRRQ